MEHRHRAGGEPHRLGQRRDPGRRRARLVGRRGGLEVEVATATSAANSRLRMPASLIRAAPPSHGADLTGTRVRGKRLTTPAARRCESVDSALGSAVAVMGQTDDVLLGPLPGPQPHVEGVQGEVGAQAGGHLPADQHPGEHVDHQRRIRPARICVRT
jgi:hypothetical protein